MVTSRTGRSFKRKCVRPAHQRSSKKLRITEINEGPCRPFHEEGGGGGAQSPEGVNGFW